MKVFYSKFLLLFLVLLFQSCGIYSLRDASIPSDIKTVSIDFFPNLAPIISPTLSQVFTEKIKNKFIAETNLNLVTSDGDMQFSGKITDYRTAPVAIQGNQTTATTRLSMTVMVKFVNLKDPTKNFETAFNNYVDFSSTENFSSIESQLIREVTEKIVQDIFNRAVINW